MNTHEIIFPLNNNTKIIIPLQDPVEWLGPMYEEDILLFYNNNKIFLSRGTIFHDMLELADLLQKAIKNKLSLHHSITSDIGYSLNEYHINEDHFATHTFPSGMISWVGYLYKLWEGNSDDLRLTTWIYNDNNSNIIFEVTPFYPYMFCEPEEEPNYVSYEEWIKTYKPYLITILSREIAQKWLEQAEAIIKIIENNETQWQKKRKN